MKRLITYFMIAACFNSGIALGACDKNKPESTPSSRFVLNDGEAFDKQTKLTWSRCSVGATWNKSAKCAGSVRMMRLDEAKQYAQKLGSGWRVPSIDELYSIIEHRCDNPSVNAKVFPNVENLGEGAPYWSMTSIKEMPPLVYYLDFLSGEADGHTKRFSMAVRLVRSGK